MNSTRVATLGLLIAVAMLLIAVAHGPSTGTSPLADRTDVVLVGP